MSYCSFSESLTFSICAEFAPLSVNMIAACRGFNSELKVKPSHILAMRLNYIQGLAGKLTYANLQCPHIHQYSDLNYSKVEYQKWKDLVQQVPKISPKTPERVPEVQPIVLEEAHRAHEEIIYESSPKE